MAVTKSKKKFYFERLYYLVDREGIFSSEHKTLKEATQALRADTTYLGTKFEPVAVVQVKVCYRAKP